MDDAPIVDIDELSLLAKEVEERAEQGSLFTAAPGEQVMNLEVNS